MSNRCCPERFSILICLQFKLIIRFRDVIQARIIAESLVQASVEKIHTTVQRFGVGKIVLMFLTEVSYAQQGCIYLIENMVKTVIL